MIVNKLLQRRFNWPSELSCAIAESMLEDKEFVKSYTAQSRELLSRHYAFATNFLDKNSIEYFKGGQVYSFSLVQSLTYS